MKKAISLLLALLLISALAGCGGKDTDTKDTNKNTAKDVDVTKLAAELAEKVAFESELKDLSDKLSFIVDLPEGAQSAFYRGEGESKEQIIAVKCAGESDAAGLKADLETLLADQIQEAERYTPELVSRLQNAVLIQKGQCVVLCVTDDAATARSIIEGYLG